MPTGPVRTLRSLDAVVSRREKLSLSHIAPLRDFVLHLRAENRGAVPDFDPLDGGIDAQVLFLMEKPGPMTDHTAIAGRVGSGFISRDNDDPTAEATLRFMEAAQIDRRTSVIWNTVPWWNGTRRISPDEHRAGIGQLESLFDLLPKLRVVVGVGAKARKAEPLVKKMGLEFILSAHPSPINRASRPTVWAEIPHQWAKAKDLFSKLSNDAR